MNVILRGGPLKSCVYSHLFQNPNPSRTNTRSIQLLLISPVTPSRKVFNLFFKKQTSAIVSTVGRYYNYQPQGANIVKSKQRFGIPNLSSNSHDTFLEAPMICSSTVWPRVQNYVDTFYGITIVWGARLICHQLCWNTFCIKIIILINFDKKK